MWRGSLNPPPEFSDAEDVDRSPPQSETQNNPAELAHELNNLLDGSMKTVASAVRTLQGTPSLEGPTSDAIRRLHRSEQLMQRMVGLLESLGQTSGDVSQLIPATSRNQTLGEAIDHALRCVEVEASEAAVTLDALVDPRLAALPADALYTVVSNGLHNALDAVRSRDAKQHGKRVELRLYQEERDAVLTIADTGPGIDAALRLPGGGFCFGVTTKPDGNGIGLGLSRQVAMALNGKLWLRDRLPCGAVLTLRFPVSALEALCGQEGPGAT